MSEGGKEELAKAVLEAAIQQENDIARAAVGTGGGYADSFSGTKNDTQVYTLVGNGTPATFA